MECQLECKDAQNPDDGDKEYWDMLSDADDSVDMTNFMFRILLKEAKEGGFCLLMVSLLNLDNREF